jgi:succinyl-CoA synthetase beta subunit
MANALEVINTDPNVRVILVNIFGGIVRCDEVAQGILTALERVELTSPIVLRLDGTNSIEARRMLDEARSEWIIPELTMIGAAQRAVEIAGGLS